MRRYPVGAVALRDAVLVAEMRDYELHDTCGYFRGVGEPEWAPRFNGERRPACWRVMRLDTHGNAQPFTGRATALIH